MNILIVANHFPICSARYASEAFQRLGHTVKHIGPSMGRNIWGLHLPEGSEWEPDWKELTSAHYPGNPELTLIMDSDTQLTNTTGSLGGVQVVWGVDNHVRDYRREWFDHYFLAHRNPSVMDWDSKNTRGYPTRDLGNGFAEVSLSKEHLDMTHLPCCYDPTQHTPSPIPWSERKYDVAVLGMMYPQRMEAVKELQAAGLKVIWGCGAIGDTYRDLHHNSRIALNLSFNGDVGLRVFETAAMGCLVMSDECPDFKTLKPEGFWLLETGRTLTEQVKLVLNTPTIAEAAIAKSRVWAASHTWDNRAQTIVEWYEKRTA